MPAVGDAHVRLQASGNEPCPAPWVGERHADERWGRRPSCTVPHGVDGRRLAERRRGGKTPATALEHHLSARPHVPASRRPLSGTNPPDGHRRRRRQLPDQARRAAPPQSVTPAGQARRAHPASARRAGRTDAMGPGRWRRPRSRPHTRSPPALSVPLIREVRPPSSQRGRAPLRRLWHWDTASVSAATSMSQRRGW